MIPHDTLVYENSFLVEGKTFKNAGHVSSQVKALLKNMELSKEVVRRAAVVTYEAEINICCYAERGKIVLANTGYAFTSTDGQVAHAKALATGGTGGTVNNAAGNNALNGNGTLGSLLTVLLALVAVVECPGIKIDDDLLEEPLFPLLIRVLCKDCREAFPPDAPTLKKLNLPAGVDITIKI